MISSQNSVLSVDDNVQIFLTRTFKNDYVCSSCCRYLGAISGLPNKED